MKATESKTTASQVQTQKEDSKPFFSMEGQGGVFDSATPFFSGAEQPNGHFFSAPAPVVQTKLTVGAPDDPYEREADAMADKVVQRLAISPSDGDRNDDIPPVALDRPSALQRKCAACEQEEKEKIQEKPEGGALGPFIRRKPIFESGNEPAEEMQTPGVQRMCSECAKEQEEEQHIRKKSDGSGESVASESVSARLSAGKGGGSSLPEATRTSMESAFGADFSGVRIHTDSAAVQLSRDLNAQAFTHGSDVYFGAGKYNPSTGDGQRLLAHELTHTIQQGSAVRRKPDPALAAGKAKSAPLAPVQTSAPVVQKKTEPETELPEEKKGQADLMRMSVGSAPPPEEEGNIRRKESENRSAQVSPTLESQIQNTKGKGSSLDGDIRSQMENAFQADFSGVNIHTDTQAADMSRRLGARAFTYGSDVYFGSGKYTPGTKDGDHLLAHELTHVGQQAESNGLARYPEDRSTHLGSDQVCYAPNYVQQFSSLLFPYTPAAEDLSLPSRILLTQPTERSGGVSVPGAVNYLNLPYTPSSVDRLNLYAIPREYVHDSPEEVQEATCSPQPNGFPYRNPERDEQTWFGFSTFSSWLNVGQTGYTSTGPVQIVHLTPEFVVTNTLTVLAVGAANLTVVRSAAGASLIDAGVEHIGGTPVDALARAAIQELTRLIPEKQIVEINITHAHADHINLLPRLAEAGFQIGVIRITALQATLPYFERTFREMMDGFEPQIRREIEAGRGTWERTQPTESLIDPTMRETLWRNYLEAEVATRLARVQPRVELLFQGPQGLEIVEANIIPIGTNRIAIRLPEGSEVHSGAVGSVLQESLRTTFVDPEAGIPRTLSSAQADALSQNFIMELPGGSQLVVVADPRASDFASLRENFERALSNAGVPARFRLFQMGHHGQSGFLGGERPGNFRIANAVQLREMISMLSEYSQVLSQAGTRAGNAIVVSGNPDFISPANIWLLRNLGFEVFIATGANQIEVLNVVSGLTGESLMEGIIGQPYGGGRPSEALLSRASMGMADLQRQISLLENMATIQELDAEQIEQLERLRTDFVELQNAVDQYTRDVVNEIGRGPRDTSRPTIAPDENATVEPGQTSANLIRQILTRIGFETRFQAGEVASAQFSSPVLAILGRTSSNTPNEIRNLYERIDAIQANLEEGTVQQASRLELITEMTSLKATLESILPDTPAHERNIIEREIARLESGLNALMSDRTLTAESSTDPNGVRRTTRLIVENAPTDPRTQWTPGRQRLEQGFGLAGRGFGAIMIYHSITGEERLLQGLNTGDVNTLEALAGTSHNLLGASVGIRMVRAIHVHPGEIVLMAVLDFSQALARDYASPEQRNIDVTYSAIRNTLNTTLFFIGAALMRSGNPWIAGAGFVVMLLGDPILNALGVYNLLEDWLSFDPAEVVDVRQELRDLMEEYSIIIGSIRLKRRELNELRQLGAHDPQGLRNSAQEAISNHLEDARDLEDDLMEEFQEGYEEARTSYAGLMGLDQMRRLFLQLRDEANSSSTEPDTGRNAIIEGFREIESSLDMSEMNEEDIREMDQWEEIDDKLNDVEEEISDAGSDNWYEWFDSNDMEDLSEELDNVRRMFENARYRIRPEQMGSFRRESLIRPGTTAYQAYLRELTSREERYRQLLSRSTSLSLNIERSDPSVNTCGDAISFITSQRQSYESLVEQTEARLNGIKSRKERSEMLSSPEKFTHDYRAFLSRDNVEDMVLRIQIAETALLEAINQARFMTCAGVADQTQVISLENEVLSAQTLIRNRRDKYYIILPSEREHTLNIIQSKEDQAVLEVLGGLTHGQELTEMEQIALRSDELEDVGGLVSTIQSQLNELHELQGNNRRLRLLRLHGEDRSGRSTSAPRDAIFAHTGIESGEHISMSGHYYEYKILPITRSAIEFFGDRDPRYYSESAMQFISIEDLRNERR